MSEGKGRAARFGAFVALAVVVAAVVGLAGALPARRLGGEGGVAAWLWGCAASLVASLIGGVPLLLAAGRPPAERTNAALAAGAARMAVAVAAALVLALGTPLPRAPLLLGLAVAYAGQLVVDGWYALRAR
jgi:hypothetical protein